MRKRPKSKPEPKTQIIRGWMPSLEKKISAVCEVIPGHGGSITTVEGEAHTIAEFEELWKEENKKNIEEDAQFLLNFFGMSDDTLRKFYAALTQLMRESGYLGGHQSD